MQSESRTRGIVPRYATRERIGGLRIQRERSARTSPQALDKHGLALGLYGSRDSSVHNLQTSSEPEGSERNARFWVLELFQLD